MCTANLVEQSNKYRNQNLYICGEKIRMNDIAKCFSNLYGKNVIYNPLLSNEISNMEFPSSKVMAQMCQFLSKCNSLRFKDYCPQHDIEVTKELMSNAPSGSNSTGHHYHHTRHTPTTFYDWLLTHSDSTAFQQVGLDVDGDEISNVAVFLTASSSSLPYCKSVINGLLSDTRKTYKIRVAVAGAAAAATTSMQDIKNNLIGLPQEEPNIDRIEFINVDFNDLQSCSNAIYDMDGVFVVANFLYESRTTRELEEENYVKTIIDASYSASRAASGGAVSAVKHIVIATIEGIQDVNTLLPEKDIVHFTPRARIAAYARTKQISVTYLLLPCYPELFLNMIEVDRTKQVGTDKNKLVLRVGVPKLTAEGQDNQDYRHHTTKVAIFGLDELGNAVANIFDSYECYSGHEIGLVSDFVSISDVKDVLQDVLLFSKKEEEEDKGTTTTSTTQSSSAAEEVEEKGAEKATTATTTKTISSSSSTSSSSGTKEQCIQPNGTYMKDLGQLFASLSHAPEVRSRHSVAKTFKLVPNAKNLRRWVEQNQHNPVFREKLGIR